MAHGPKTQQFIQPKAVHETTTTDCHNVRLPQSQQFTNKQTNEEVKEERNTQTNLQLSRHLVFLFISTIWKLVYVYFLLSNFIHDLKPGKHIPVCAFSLTG